MSRKSYRVAQIALRRIDPMHDSDALHTAIIEMGLEALTESPVGLVSRARYRAIDERRARKRITPEYLARRYTIRHVRTPVEELEAREAKDFVLAAMDRLDGKYRQTLHLYYWDRLLPKQIATKLGVPVQTIYTRLSRATDLLARDPTLTQLKD